MPWRVWCCSGPSLAQRWYLLDMHACSKFVLVTTFGYTIWLHTSLLESYLQFVWSMSALVDTQLEIDQSNAWCFVRFSCDRPNMSGTRCRGMHVLKLALVRLSFYTICLVHLVLRDFSCWPFRGRHLSCYIRVFHQFAVFSCWQCRHILTSIVCVAVSYPLCNQNWVLPRFATYLKSLTRGSRRHGKYSELCSKRLKKWEIVKLWHTVMGRSMLYHPSQRWHTVSAMSLHWNLWDIFIHVVQTLQILT